MGGIIYRRKKIIGESICGREWSGAYHFVGGAINGRGQLWAELLIDNFLYNQKDCENNFVKKKIQNSLVFFIVIC